MQYYHTEESRGNNHIIIYDKSRNFVIKTYKKEKNEIYDDIFNETLISKKRY